MELTNNELLTTEAGGGFAPFKVVVSCAAAVLDERVVEAGVGLEIVFVAVGDPPPEVTWATCADTVCSADDAPFEALWALAVVPVTEVVEVATGFKVCAAEPVPVVSELPFLEVQSAVEFCCAEYLPESSP